MKTLVKDSGSFEVWISKFALTAGLYKVTVTLSTNDLGVVHVVGRGKTFFGEGLEWHRTREEAVQRANVLRVAKIASLEKRILKLRGLNFEEPK